MGIIIIMHTQSNLVNHRVGEVWEGTGRGKPLSSGAILMRKHYVGVAREQEKDYHEYEF